MSLKVLQYFLVLCVLDLAQGQSLNQIFAWKKLDFGFPSEYEQYEAIANGLYKENSGTPIDVDVHYTRDGSRKVFTTIPRFTKGIPYTLAIVSNEVSVKGPIIQPYPAYYWHNLGSNCMGITSAFRVAIDECDHLWVIDSGLVAGVQICPPQLLTFDLNTDQLIRRYTFTENVFTPAVSMLITPAVDIRDPPPSGSCREAMVYIADVNNHGLVVYDSLANTSWRIQNKLMYPDPDWGTHIIDGKTFDMMDGIFTINLTPHNEQGIKRYLYFHALSSDTENAVPLNLIDNRTIWQNNPEAMPDAFRVLGRRGVQAAMEAIDSRGNLFTSTHDPLTLFSWNIKLPYMYDSFKIVATDSEQLQFPAGMKIVKNPQGEEELWMSTCGFQKIATGTQNPNEINFRILACKVNDLLGKRRCSHMNG